MIAKVTRRDYLPGLVTYLFSEQGGDGKRNEHTNPRIIAGDMSIDEPTGDHLTGEQVRNLARTLDAPYGMYGTEVPAGHSWHLSLSTKGGVDRDLSDREWAAIATEAMERLGFTAGVERVGCRWVAVHHGKALKGNDHIHIAVNLVREDGTVADTWNDYRTLSMVCHDMEVRYGLLVVEGRTKGGMPAVKRAEVERAERGGRSEPERTELARRVRAAAVSSRTEDEFVRRLRSVGAAIRPRYGRGGTRDVVGYAVAVAPGDGQQFLWYSGGKLAKDLALPRLRESWAEDAEARQAAVGEWGTGAHVGRGRVGRHTRSATWDDTSMEWGTTRSPVATGGREAGVYAPHQWQEAGSRLGQVVRDLAAIPAEDRAGWEAAAGEAAGVLAALSGRLEPVPGPIAAAADVLARSAQREQTDGPHLARRVPSGTMRTVAAVMAQAQITDEVAVAWQLMLTELLRLAEAIRRAHQARGELQQAGRLTDQAQAALTEARAHFGSAQRVADLIPGLLDQIAETDERNDESADRRRRKHQAASAPRPSEFAALAARKEPQRDPAHGPER